MRSPVLQQEIMLSPAETLADAAVQLRRLAAIEAVEAAMRASLTP